MAGKHKWDEFIDFNDWEQDDAFREEINGEESVKTVEKTEPKEIQGIGITREEEEIDLSAMIAGLNAENKEYVKIFEKEESDALQEREREEEAKLQSERAKDAFEVYEREQAEREAREFIRQEEEAKRIARELERKQNSLLNKTVGMFTGKKKRNLPKEETREEPVREEESRQEASVAEQPAEEETEQRTENGGSEESGQETDLLREREILPPDERIADSGKITVIDGKNLKKSGKKQAKHTKQDQERQDELREGENILPKEEEQSSLSAVSETEENGENRDGLRPAAQDDPDLLQRRSVTETKKGLFSFKKGKNTEKTKTGSGKEKQKGEKDPQEEPPAEEQAEKSSGRGQKKDKIDWEYVAMHDEMTGLYNQRAYARKKEEKFTEPFAVIYIDVNNLKYTNDTIGHEAGNELIIATAKQVDALFPDEGYRTGGDEFIAVAEDIPVKKADKILSDRHAKFHKAMEELTGKSADKKLIYAASFGYAYSDGTKSFEQTAKEAEESMYAEKAAYKKAHPEYDMRRARTGKNDGKLTKEKITPTDPEKYDEFLTKEQQELKKRVRAEHTRVSDKSTMEIVREIQSRASELVAVLIASPTFDHLFIIQTADTFINVVSESESVIDYSYLYIIYRDGPVYKGADEYLEEITDIFSAIGKGLITGKIREEKDILKIRGINIFKNIYVD